MPAIQSGKVLVTGANGYIAMWVIQTLLERGYSVRAAVRAESKAPALRKAFVAYGDKLEFAIVPDIAAAGAFDEAVKGVDAIEHIASPVVASAGDPEELIVPAVNGTTGVLKSALAHGTAVKRVVVTSSTGAITPVKGVQGVFTEADWNESVLRDCEQNGRAANIHSKYQASKVFAERAAWALVEENKGRIGWDLVVLCPPWVFGPTLCDVDAPDKLNLSMKLWYDSVLKGFRDPMVELGSWVDVRDLAVAHVVSLEKQETGGERIIVSGLDGQFTWKEWISAAKTLGATVPADNPGEDDLDGVPRAIYDTSKAARLLGVKYHSILETSRDTLEDFKAKGWL